MNTYSYVDSRGNYHSFKFDIRKLESAVLQIFKSQAPVHEGILKGQIRLRSIENGFEIVSDIYYMQYTEEKWGYNSRWKKVLINPNEGWFREAFNLSLQFLQSVTGKGFKRVS